MQSVEPHEHQYPHTNGDVSASDLEADLAEYPEAYHELLVPAIRRHLENAAKEEDSSASTKDLNSPSDEIIRLLTIGEHTQAIDLVEASQGLSQDVAQYLIDTDCDCDLAYNLSRFSTLSRNIAIALVSRGWSYQVLKHREKFDSLPTKEIQFDLLQSGKADLLIQNRDLLALSQHELVDLLYRWGFVNNIVNHLDKFDCTEELFWQLIDSGCFRVLSKIDKFDGQEINDVIQKLLTSSNGSCSRYIEEIDNLSSGLNIETAKLFIDTGQWKTLKFCNRWFDIDWNELCEYVYQVGSVRHIPTFIQFASELSGDIADELVALGRHKVVVDNLAKFPSLDRQDLANVLLKSKNGVIYLVNYLEKFSMLDKKLLVSQLLEHEDGPHYLMRNLEKFTDIDGSVAYRLIDSGCAEDVWNHIDCFTDIDYNNLIIYTMAAGVEAYKFFPAIRAVASREANFVISNEVVLRFIKEGCAYDLLYIMEYIPPEDAELVIKAAVEDGNISAVLNMLHSMPDFVDKQKVIQLLMDKQAYEYLAGRVDSFPQIDVSELATKLIEKKAYAAIFANLSSFPSVNIDDLCGWTIDDMQYHTIVSNIKYFNSLDASMMLECARLDPSRVVENIHRFKDIDKQILLDYLFSCGREQILLRNAEQFEGLDTNAIIKSAISGNNEWLVIQNLSSLSNVEPWVAEHLLGQGYTNIVYENLNSFKDLSGDILLNMIMASAFPCDAIPFIDKLDKIIDTKPLIMRSLNSGYVYEIINNLEKITSVGQEDILRIVEENGLGKDIIENLGKFTSVNCTAFIIRQFQEDPVATIEALANGSGWMMIDFDDPQSKVFSDYFESTNLKSMQADVYSGLVKILSRSKASQVPKDLYEQTSKFGKYTNIYLAIATDELRKGILNEECAVLGITETGERGVTMLQGKILDLLGRFNLDQLTEDDYEILTKSKIASTLLMTIAEYDPDTTWGDRSESALESKLNYRRNAEAAGVIEPLDTVYSPSRVYNIEKLDKTSEPEQWSPDVIERYNLLISDINHVKNALREPMGISRLVRELRSKIDLVSEKLSSMIDSIDEGSPKAEIKRRNLQKRRDTLQQYIQQIDTGDVSVKRFVMNSPDDFQKGFAHFEPYEELHAAMRRLTFAWALHKNPGQRVLIDNLNAVPEAEDLSRLSQFVEVMVNADTFGDYFSDKRLASKFRRMTSTKAFEEALLREQQRALKKSGNTELQFMPTRGMLFELSGQIGGACWADVHASIAEDKPQITGLIMRARPGTDSERIVGAALMIKTKEQGADDGVLLLRGLNPKENYINKVNPESFYNAVTDYVREMAAKQGLKPAIVIDDHSGGSGTNRPSLFAYLNDQKKSMQNIMVDHDSTYFNGYNVTRDSYAL